MPAKKDASINLLDSVLILVLAFTMALFILWMAGQLRGRELFTQLPPWMGSIASSVWSWATGAAGTIVLGWLRRRTARNARTPNYLAWAGGGTVAILLMVTLVTAMVPPAPAPQTGTTELARFDLKVQVRDVTGDVTRVAFQQRQPRVRTRENIALQPDGMYYKATADFPDRCGMYQANIYPVTDASVLGGPTAPTGVAFYRNPTDPKTDTTEVILECTLGRPCTISRDDLGWAIADDAACKNAFRRGLGFGTVLHAQSGPVEPQAGWRVPSLATLTGLQGSKAVGYTKFSITSESLKSLGPVDSFVYLVRVNGTPIYVDGAQPEDMVEPVSATDRFLFEFGLENLNFSGHDNGCERIDLSLQFRQGSRLVRTVNLSRQYAALRDADPLTLSPDALSFVWSAQYIKPPGRQEDSNEVFVASGTSPDAIAAIKTRIDALELHFRDSRIVAVMRPPLNNPSYSVLVGIVQPSGQIKFTFDAATATALMAEVNAERKQRLAPLHLSEPFIYRTRPGDAGTGTMKACRE